MGLARLSLPVSRRGAASGRSENRSLAGLALCRLAIALAILAISVSAENESIARLCHVNGRQCDRRAGKRMAKISQSQYAHSCRSIQFDAASPPCRIFALSRRYETY